jgi:Deoxyribonuclease II
MDSFWRSSRAATVAISLAVLALGSASAEAPVPLLAQGQPSGNWWFAFKLNSATFPMCRGGDTRKCLFDGHLKPVDYEGNFSQQYTFASPGKALKDGDGCIGDTLADPVGATFDQVYNGDFNFVVWNDQFYDDPKTHSCGDGCGHSKGIVVWDDAGDGFVLQVSTPNWPGAGSKGHPRPKNGNSLGCILQPKEGGGEKPEDNVEVSQHFFAVKLNKADLLLVLDALENASVNTDPANAQLVRIGGPGDVQDAVKRLGPHSHSTAVKDHKLSSGVRLISKPAKLVAPPWQVVSAVLGGVPLRVASWWERNKIRSTTNATPVGCLDGQGLAHKPGDVLIVEEGSWDGKTIGLVGGNGKDRNHAKIGVSTSGPPLTIFGDMNQEGTLSPVPEHKCEVSQNPRGGLFYVVDDPILHEGVAKLIGGKTDPVQ